MDSVYTTSLPTLSPEDQALLTSYFEANEDLHFLAKQPGSKDLLSLLQWLSRPDIAAYVHAYRTHQSHLHRNVVIQALQSVLKNTTDPIETRRAATTLLRALNPIRFRPSPSQGDGGGGTRPSKTTHRHPPANRSGPRNNPITPPPASTAAPTSPPQPLTNSPFPSRPSLAQALAILGIPNLTDEEEDALEDAQIDALDDEPFDADENTS